MKTTAELIKELSQYPDDTRWEAVCDRGGARLSVYWQDSKRGQADIDLGERNTLLEWGEE